MAHNILNPKSPNVSNTYNVADAEPITVVSYVASEGIAVGDLVTLNPASGTLTYALPPDRLTQGSTLRPLYAPLESYGGQMAPVTARAPSGATAVSYGLNAQTLHSITLKSGNILHAWVSESAAVLMITGLDNGFYFEPTAISGGGVIYPCVLAGGGFAVVTVVGGQSKIYVYSDVGVQTATATMSGTPLAICALTGGNFVVETTIAGTGSISIGIFNRHVASCCPSHKSWFHPMVLAAVV